MDDTIDEFGNLATGVVSQLAKTDYTAKQYRQFYKSILYVYNYERQLYNGLTQNEKDNLNQQLIKNVAEVENELERKSGKIPESISEIVEEETQITTT